MSRNERAGQLRRYAGPAVVLAALLVIWIVEPARAADALGTIGLSLRQMLLVIPAAFVLLGLLDVWVSRERLMRHMGRQSGVGGTVIAFVMGSVAAGPLYAAFPVATILMRKGCSLFNVPVFVGAWSTTKVPMFLFEYSSLGAGFALTRLAANIPAILLMSLLISRMVPEGRVRGARGTEVGRTAKSCLTSPPGRYARPIHQPLWTRPTW